MGKKIFYVKNLGRRSFGSSKSGLGIGGESEGMTDHQWMSLEKKTCSVIRGCLMDAALYSVLDERIPKDL